MEEKLYCVYILTSNSHTVLYIGVINNLVSRVIQHREGAIEGFTKKYNVSKLVYWEGFGDIDYAISREKQLKGWRRQKKIDLIEIMNPN
ncbi:MAG: GIY-YIG nuclease family protein [Patescibacteria group bacterium]